jgi:glucose-1-phosphate thymidylyltransferase
MPVKGLVLAESGGDASGGDGAGCAELFPVANRPILFHALEAMAAGGIQDVAFCGPPERVALLRDAVGAANQWDMRFAYIEDQEALPASAIHAAGDFLDGSTFLFQHGDGLLQDDLRSLVRAGQTLELDALLLMHRRAGGPAAAGAQLLGTAFAAGTHPYLDEHRLEAEISGLVRGLGEVGDADVRLIRGWRRFGGSSSELLEMNRIVLDAITDEPCEPHDSGSRIEGRVRLHPTALVEGSVIRGPAIVGAGTRISNSYIGPYTAIGDDVWVDGTEITHSIVRSRARLLHLGTRLEDTVVGRDARVSREFGLSRSLRMQLGDGAQVVLQ